VVDHGFRRCCTTMEISLAGIGLANQSCSVSGNTWAHGVDVFGVCSWLCFFLSERNEGKAVGCALRDEVAGRGRRTVILGGIGDEVGTRSGTNFSVFLVGFPISFGELAPDGVAAFVSVCSGSHRTVSPLAFCVLRILE
jgi:hypothetical protein